MNNKCFNGGDANHKEAANQVNRAIKTCTDKLNKIRNGKYFGF